MVRSNEVLNGKLASYKITFKNNLHFILQAIVLEYATWILLSICEMRTAERIPTSQLPLSHDYM